MNTSRTSRHLPVVLLSAAALGLGACTSVAEGDSPILVSGSATVEPITTAMARQANVTVDVAAEGTTDGFDRFCRGETAINNASIPIPGEDGVIDYQQLCADNGVEFLELPIGLDALTLVRNGEADFAGELSLAQLTQLWEGDSQVAQWSDLDPAWPAEDIGLYGRPEGSGTLVYFTEEILGPEGQLRQDYEGSDEIDELSSWIAADPNGIGFMGVGNYLATDGELRRDLNNIAVDGVTPSRENAQSGQYPLTRPLFLYVSVAALEDENVENFVEHYVTNVEQMLPRVYYFPLPSEAYELLDARLTDRRTGTLFTAGETAGDADVVELLRQD